MLIKINKKKIINEYKKLILIIVNNVDPMIKRKGSYLKKSEIFYFYRHIIHNYDKCLKYIFKNRFILE